MSIAFASAMLLQCFFNQPADGSVAPGDIPVIKVPIPAAMAESMRAGQPPLSLYSFTGESGTMREWIIGNAPADAATIQLLRVSLSEAVLPPSPYSARFGTAIRTDDGSYRFESKMTGYCKLLPSDGVQQ